MHFTHGPAPAVGDPVLLEWLVANLVGNAIRHNHSGGWLTVATSTQDGAAALLEVTNSGPVVRSHEADSLFDPFRRLDNANHANDNGFGLGLSIVRAITDAHHGTVSLHPRAERGLAVRVALPRR
ncbi:ATP-binding protein [Phytohabitans sp. ZYX-F-186]|uniref:histidine kinase n=1 Tax=Phytohabitans maris TaxID=3071409 RepID=A0ABU0ZMA7_9ACTN|nr:ATP-binding protein [Phytohabitans sp. ZYX-F-186]MDQ7907547.1 ATP-binding protein [Phytohabitans sp. ZYX-F-186]